MSAAPDRVPAVHPAIDGMEAKPPSTTISTIAVQSGGITIVLALLQSKDVFQLKIQEMKPAMTDVGANLEEAVRLLKQHEEALHKIATKQSPVEELLNQVDELISNQKPRARVYSAMAENLGLAWKDLNWQLDQRKKLLEQAVAFYTRMKEFSDKMDLAEKDFYELDYPFNVDLCRTSLSNHHDAKKGMLEGSMSMLYEGQTLLEQLQKIGADNLGDSRPAYLDSATKDACYAVEQHMEVLQDRRRQLELLWKHKKIFLEQHIQMCLISEGLNKVQMWLNTSGLKHKKQTELGSSAAQAESLLKDHQKFEFESKEKQDQTIHFLHKAERLYNAGYTCHEEIKTKAYTVLAECSELLAALENRLQLLETAAKFFTLADKALTKWSQLEPHMKVNSVDSKQMNQMLSQVDNLIKNALEEGYTILSTVGRSEPGTQGVVKKVDELESLQLTVENLKRSTVTRLSAYNSLLEKYTTLHIWITSAAENFLRDNQDMGSTLTAARDITDLHIQFHNDSKAKGDQIESICNSIAESLKPGDPKTSELRQKLDDIQQQWKKLNFKLERRILIMQSYVSFLKIAAQLTECLESIETILAENSDKPAESISQLLAPKWNLSNQLLEQVRSSANTFNENTTKIEDPYLNIRSAVVSAESLIIKLQERKQYLSSVWQERLRGDKEQQNQWKSLVQDVLKSVEVITNMEDELFPVIPKDLKYPQSISSHLKRRLETLVPLIKKVHVEMDAYAKAAEAQCFRGDMEAHKDELTEKLQRSYQDFEKKINGYENLVSMMIRFFNNVQKLEDLIKSEEAKSTTISIPGEDSHQIESLIRKHDANCSFISELLKSCEEEARHLIGKVNEVEPYSAALSDKEKISSIVDSYVQRKAMLKEYRKKIVEYQQCFSFGKDIKQISLHIDELSKQLQSIRESCCKSLTAAKAASLTFQEFHKNIKGVEERVQQFTTQADTVLQGHSGDTSYYQLQIQNLKKKWLAFCVEVERVSHLIEAALEYFNILSEVEEWLKESNKLLVATTRKSRTCKSSEDAVSLLDVVDNYLKQGKPKQEERLRKMSTLAMQLYDGGTNSTLEQVTEKTQEVIKALSSISIDLTNAVKRLKSSEEDKEKTDLDVHMVNEEVSSNVQKFSSTMSSTLTSAHLVSTFMKQMKVTTSVSSSPDTLSWKSNSQLESGMSLYKAPEFTKPLLDCEVTEGAKCTFQCQVEGFPQPQVEWYKDGILIQKNPDYKIVHNNGICTLTIEETLPDDSAHFTCKAINLAGIAETHGCLRVKESQPQLDYKPPSFTKPLEMGIIKEGMPFQFQCQVTGVPLPLVSWLKDGFCIDNSPDYTITYNNGHCKLRIERTTIADNGQYTCRAVNPSGRAECTERLTIQQSPSVPIKAPMFLLPLSNLMARAGQKLRLECEVHGQPKPALTWLHDNKPVKESRDVKIHYDGNKATLVITEAFLKDAGTYTVVAKNSAGEATTTCNIVVKGRPPMETSDSELPSDLEPVKPRVMERLKNQTVPEGSAVRMDCVIVGQPEPEVIWYHNNNPVKESGDFQLLFEGDRCSLLIKEAYPEDSGWYKCVAINSAGEASSQCILSVDPHTEVTEIEKSHQEYHIIEEKSYPPTFRKTLEDVAAMEGQCVQLQCQVAGYPVPTITWHKDACKIEDSDEYQITSDKAGSSSLTILELRPEDRGRYTVKAKNRAGEAQSLCTVEVNSRRTPPKTPPKPAANDEPPQFSKFLENIHTQRERVAKFECVVSGIPTPEVKWFFKGSPLNPSPEHKISRDGDRHSLVIPEIKFHHQGRYTITAENDCGKATSSALLVVEEPFDEPVMLNGLENKRFHSLQRLKNVTLMNSNSFSEAEEVSRVENHSIEHRSDVSFHSSTQEDFREVNSGVTKVHHTVINKGHTLPLSRKQPASLVSAMSPNFVTPVTCIVAEEGQEIRLQGSIEANPEPDVKWLKNGTELFSSSLSPIISFRHGVATLVIPKATMSDAGSYTCMATNVAGSASCTADVIVQQHSTPPAFLKPLEAQAVPPGSPIHFEVEITGDPPPKVQWFHNDSLLTSGPSFQISSHGTTHTLHIPQATQEHAGKLKVCASNAAGESRCVADIVVSEGSFVREVKTTAYREMSVTEMRKEVSLPIVYHTDV